MNSNLFYNAVGVIGASCLLFGFYRISIGKWKNKSFWYELDNLAGALFLIIYQMHLHAYISVVLNIIWMMVAFRGIVSFVELAFFDSELGYVELHIVLQHPKQHLIQCLCMLFFQSRTRPRVWNPVNCLIQTRLTYHSTCPGLPP